MIKRVLADPRFRRPARKRVHRSGRDYRLPRTGLLLVVNVSVLLRLLRATTIQVGVCLDGEQAKRYTNFFFGGKRFMRGHRGLSCYVRSLFLEDGYVRRQVCFGGNKRQRAGSFLHLVRRPTSEIGLILVSGTLRRGVKEGLSHCLPCLFQAAFILFPSILRIFAYCRSRVVITCRFKEVSSCPSRSHHLLNGIRFGLKVVISEVDGFYLVAFYGVGAILI